MERKVDRGRISCTKMQGRLTPVDRARIYLLHSTPSAEKLRYSWGATAARLEWPLVWLLDCSNKWLVSIKYPGDTVTDNRKRDKC